MSNALKQALLNHMISWITLHKLNEGHIDDIRLLANKSFMNIRVLHIYDFRFFTSDVNLGREGKWIQKYYQWMSPLPCFIVLIGSVVLMPFSFQKLYTIVWQRPSQYITVEDVHRALWISAWISNYSHHKIRDEIDYALSNFNGCTLEVGESISNFIPHYTMDVITYPCWDGS